MRDLEFLSATMYFFSRRGNLDLSKRLNRIFLLRPTLFMSSNRQEIYLNNYPSLLVTGDSLEKSLEFYNQYVPKFLKPNPALYNALADALLIYQADDQKSHELGGLFNATRDVADYALRAANVYKNIALAIEEAQKAAKRAFEAAEKAYKVAVPDFEESLAAKALASKRKSLELLEKAKRLRDQDVQRLSLELARRKQLVDQLFEDIKSMKNELEQINAGLKQLADKNLLEQSQEIDLYLKQLLDRLDKIHKQLQLLSDLIYGSILPQYERISAGSQSSLGNLSQVLDIARKDLLSSIKYAGNAKLSLDKMLKLEAKLNLDLDLLRRKIQLGHQEATSVHVSIMSAPDSGVCIRSYFVPSLVSAREGGLSIGGFNVKEISLIWSFHSEESESLLLFMGAKSNDDFLALEVHERRVKLVFNLNEHSPNGIQTLTHPRTLTLNDNQLLSDEAWYKIQVSVSNDDFIRLSVKSVSKAHESDTQRVSYRLKPIHGRTTKLKVSPYGEADIDFYVGGYPSDYHTPKQIKSSRLTGCLYDLTLNEQQVGLWNFKTDLGCQGCVEGPMEAKDTSAFSFTGSQSYATVGQSKVYDGTKYMVSMSVKTSNPNALLFLAISTKSNNYLSVFLSKGHVGYLIGKLNLYHHVSYLGFSSGSLFDYAFNAQLQSNNNSQSVNNKPKEHLIMTDRVYNNGRWFRITAEKDQTRLLLAVEDEFRESVADDTLLVVEVDSIFFGGVWPMIRPKKFENTSLEFEPLNGCIKDIQIETTPIDLLKRQSYGVESGCPDSRIVTANEHILYPLPVGR